ncbi:hypothetical protein J6590_006159 [Homalodisca vitripennis]|nr:hypothetical protein J6590_006159 [Homalodisca vitripennis]
MLQLPLFLYDFCSSKASPVPDSPLGHSLRLEFICSPAVCVFKRAGAGLARRQGQDNAEVMARVGTGRGQSVVSWRGVLWGGPSTTMRGSTAGITDGLRGHSAVHYAFLTLLDTLLSTLVISPLVVCYWRGTWGIMDVYVYPDNPGHSGLASLASGLGGILVFTLGQNPLARCLHPDRHRLVYYLCSRGYTAVFGFCCVNSWRGAWKLLDLYTGPGVDVVVAVTLSAVVTLAGARTLRNISAPPFAIVTDRREGYFEVPTMFKYVSTTSLVSSANFIQAKCR